MQLLRLHLIIYARIASWRHSVAPFMGAYTTMSLTCACVGVVQMARFAKRCSKGNFTEERLYQGVYISVHVLANKSLSAVLGCEQKTNRC